MTREVDGGAVAAHALVDDGASDGRAAVLDSDGLSAVAVFHDADGQREDVLGVAVIGGSAAAGVGGGGGGVVEGHVARAGGALGAGALVTGGTGRRAGLAGRAGPVGGRAGRAGSGGLRPGRRDRRSGRRRGRSDSSGCSWRVWLLRRRRDSSWSGSDGGSSN